MKKMIMVSAVAMLLAGCVSSDKIIAPDGKSTAVVVTCSGTMNSWSGCFKRLAEECPRGYDLLVRDQSQGAVVNAYGGSTTIDRSLMAVCK